MTRWSALLFIFLYLSTSIYAIGMMTRKGDHTVFDDGSMFFGTVRDGRKQGRGIFVWPDGAEFQGNFVDGDPDGTGIYQYPDGKRKTVLYDRGKMSRARFLSNTEPMDGRVYGSIFISGNYTGWFRGDRIKGYLPDGRGIMKYQNGSVYSGQWKDGRMHGNGSIRWQDGSLYSGQWMDGKRSGYGTYAWSNGDRYTGHWDDNRMCGYGSLYHSDGTIERGEWKEATIPVNY